MDREKPNTSRSDKIFTATHGTYQETQCVYCGDSSHKSADCKKVEWVSECRNILRAKGLCFICMGSGRRASSWTVKAAVASAEENTMHQFVTEHKENHRCL